MKTSSLKRTAAYLILGLFITTSCSEMCVEGEGEITSESRNLPAFHSIKLRIPGRVEIAENTGNTIKVEAQPNLLPMIKMEVSDGVLVISSKQCIGRNKGIHLQLTAPEFERLVVDGSGSITAMNTLNSQHLELAINGSGELNLTSNCESLYAGIKGSGEIKINGSSQSQIIRIDGSGKYLGRDFPSVSTETTINGSGEMDLFTIEKMKVTINGSGDIRYKGNPKLDSRINGSGSVTKME